MTTHLAGKAAVVTGGGGGIGRGIALALAGAGARVVVNDVGTAAADRVVAQIRAEGGEATASYDSVATPEGGDAIIRTALDAFGRLDILVTCAGIIRNNLLWDTTEDDWDAVQSVNIKGHFNVCKPAAVAMRDQGTGRIITFTSTAGLVGRKGGTNYGATKAAVMGFTFCLARELGEYGVTVNSISPGADTPMARDTRAFLENVARGGTPQPAFANTQNLESLDPDDVAPAVVWLCTDQAANINGQILQVRGGSIALVALPRPVKTVFKAGRWTLDELLAVMPSTILAELDNPAPYRPRVNEGV